MRITRETIIKAIKSEPLKAGEFVEFVKDEDAVLVKASDDPNCSVCAVGAVLRHKKWDNAQINNFAHDLLAGYAYNAGGDYEELLEIKQYLNALSVYFEQICPERGATKKTREKLVKFVKANFPKTITVKV